MRGAAGAPRPALPRVRSVFSPEAEHPDAEEIAREVRKHIPRAGTLGLIAGARALQRANRAGRAEEILRRSRDPIARLELFLLQRDSGRAGDAHAGLREFSRTLEADEWPSPLVRGYLGQMKDDAVLAAAADSDERCEAEYYLGRLHAKDDLSAARRLLQKATAEECDQAGFAREDLAQLQSR